MLSHYSRMIYLLSSFTFTLGKVKKNWSPLYGFSLVSGVSTKRYFNNSLAIANFISTHANLWPMQRRGPPVKIITLIVPIPIANYFNKIITSKRSPGVRNYVGLVFFEKPFRLKLVRIRKVFWIMVTGIDRHIHSHSFLDHNTRSNLDIKQNKFKYTYIVYECM